MTGGRQWRLMVNGQVVDVEDRREDPVRPQAARRGVTWRWAGWAAIVAGAAFEVLLSVNVLVEFGLSWHVFFFGLLACLLLVIGSRLMR